MQLGTQHWHVSAISSDGRDGCQDQGFEEVTGALDHAQQTLETWRDGSGTAVEVDFPDDDETGVIQRYVAADPKGATLVMVEVRSCHEGSCLGDLEQVLLPSLAARPLDPARLSGAGGPQAAEAPALGRGAEAGFRAAPLRGPATRTRWRTRRLTAKIGLVVTKEGAMRELQPTPDIRRLLLQRLHRGYAELLDELRRAGGKAESSLDGGWAVRDHLSHLAAWEAVEVARTEGRSGATEALSLALEPLRRRWSTDSAAEAFRHLETVHSRLVVALVEVEEAALRRPWHAAYPGSLAANVARNTYQHYTEHLPAIRRLLSSAPEEHRAAS